MRTVLSIVVLALSPSSVASAQAQAPNPWWDGYFASATRVALPEGSLVVNSSQGGGTKDTWVLEG